MCTDAAPIRRWVISSFVPPKKLTSSGKREMRNSVNPVFRLCYVLFVLAPWPVIGLGQDGSSDDPGSVLSFNENVGPSVPQGRQTTDDGIPIDPENPVADHGPAADHGPEAWVISREPIFADTFLDSIDDCLSRHNQRAAIPIGGGAWHWFNQSMEGKPGGYGIPPIPDTFFWYLDADPKAELCRGRSVGAHLQLRFRENGPMRNFISSQIWPWEAYAYVEDEDWGVLKAGLLYKRFGILWDGVFWGSAPYYDGISLDADYGLSWESTHEVSDHFKIERHMQFFFHEDNSNGSFPGADPESADGYAERNTGVFRFVPTWTRCDGSVVSLGVSALVGQIESSRQDISSQVPAAYEVDLSYTKGPWWLFIQGYQYFGVLNPKRYVSGGPSDRLTGSLAGIHYTHGSVTYRCSYSNSFDSNPSGTQHLMILGTTVTLTKNVDFYLEWVLQRIDGNANTAMDPDVTNSLNYIINWHF